MEKTVHYKIMKKKSSWGHLEISFQKIVYNN